MSFFRFTASLLLAISAIFSNTVVSAQEVCVVKGDTLSEARNNYANQCTLDRIDCDPFNGEWYCASFIINTPTPPALTVNNTRPDIRPTCVRQDSDSDGDGFGWENNATCLVSPQVATPVIQPFCVSADSDIDGDGFGWENNATCLVTESSTPASQPVATEVVRPSCVRADSDNDGDGFGWENEATYLVTESSVPASQRGTTLVEEEDSVAENPAPVEDSAADITPEDNAPTADPVAAEPFVMPQSGPDSIQPVESSFSASDITDLILVTGQSNALGAGTAYDPSLDAPNNRVFAFTDQGWQVADLNQVWDLDWHPRNHPETDPSNNFSLHFGKNVATEDSSRVVGFILASSPGSKIVTWNLGSSFYNTVQNKVLAALSQLPHKDAIDGILWHQGESDGQDIPSYTESLNGLIFNLRNEQWVQDQAPFICGETKIASVNRRLNGLNEDNDPNTACVEAIDLPTRDGTHFNATALRTLGARYADSYLDITTR